MTNNQITIEERWENLTKKTKNWHRFAGASLMKNVPYMFILLVVLEFMDGYRKVDLNAVIVTGILKIVLAYLMGIFWGGLEWNFLEKLVERRFTTLKEIKRDYILIYGVLFFGFFVTIGLLNPAFESLYSSLIKLVLYPLSGILWGAFMIKFSDNKLERFLSSK